jgi:LPXTG-motif cell wall-anchored protein
MSLTRRLAAGLPAVGVSAFAALAFAGTPAYATGDVADRTIQPAATATPCADSRTKCAAGDAAGDGYGYGTPDDDETPAGSDNGSNNGADDNGTDDNGSNNGADDSGGAGADDNGGADDDRGNPGYGGESPATTPPTTPPTGNTNTVPPNGVSPATSPAAPGGEVSAGDTLPVTGTPMAATIAVGTLLVAGGAAAVWYTRRRRTA